MKKHRVSVIKYEKPFESVRKAVEACGGLVHLPAGAKVFIKPNVVFWTRFCEFPKWGVITTSRVIEDVIVLLRERGIDDITIGEGIVADPKDKRTPAHAFETLGYKRLEEKYGVKTVNVMDRPFEKVDLGGGVNLKFNTDILHSDFVVDIPPMKTHNQTIVSMGIKNLKGCIDIPSRKKCHSADPQKDLHYHIARLADKMPPMLTVIDGIYTVERGPGFDGKMHRKNLLVASADILSADMVAARILGHSPANVPYLAHAAANRDRRPDLHDVEISGEPIKEVAAFHAWDVEYSCEDTREIPVPLAKQGLDGIYYRKFDNTLCTYCTMMSGLVLTAIRYAWQGEPWNQVEVLTGKVMEPAPGMKATILLGQCMYKKNKDHPDIQKQIAIKSCPPDPKGVLSALHGAGIEADPALFEQAGSLPGFFMDRYKDRPEFEKAFFQVE